MSEVINTAQEKIFFHEILKNPEQFSKVEPHFFRNSEIQFIFKVIKDEYVNSKNKLIPSNPQILAMIRLNDPEGKIPDNVVKLLLKTSEDDYDIHWIEPRFKAWKISNACKTNLSKAVEQIRGMSDLDLENSSEIASKIKNMFNNLDFIADDDTDLGSDFDDPNSHKFTSNENKMKTGWSTMDLVLDGGWDHATLAILLGSTNVGKSMWLQNIACNLVKQGKNIVIVSLEMSVKNVMKRLSAMMLKIPTKDYENRIQDPGFMKNRINKMIASNGNSLFDSKPGKIIVKKYNTGSCTVTDLDNYITKLKESKKIEIDVVILDYLGLMGIEKGLDFNAMLFLKGKHISEGLRFIADKHKVAIITATQTDKDIWDTNDINLKNIPESKAIAETADVVWGIIRNSEMKRNNKYRLKILKLRDGEQKGEEIKFDFNSECLMMENDEFVGVK